MLVPPDVAPGLDAVLAVADGMGGHQAGEVASGQAMHALRRVFSSSAYEQAVDYSPEREDYYAAVLKDVIEQIDEQVSDLAARREGLKGMGTTLTVALLYRDRAFIAHVGDSRAYLLHDGAWQQVTQDHTWVAEQIQAGAMTADEAAAHRRKNVLSQALGHGLALRVDRSIHPVAPGDALLLCSDGLTNVVNDTEIAQAVWGYPDPQSACDFLVQLANQRGGPDNITVVLARLTPQRGAIRVQGPADKAFRRQVTQRLRLRGQRRSARWFGVLWRAFLIVLGAGVVLAGAMVGWAVLTILQNIPGLSLTVVAAAILLGMLSALLLRALWGYGNRNR